MTSIAVLIFALQLPQAKGFRLRAGTVVVSQGQWECVREGSRTDRLRPGDSRVVFVGDVLRPSSATPARPTATVKYRRGNPARMVLNRANAPYTVIRPDTDVAKLARQELGKFRAAAKPKSDLLLFPQNGRPCPARDFAILTTGAEPLTRIILRSRTRSVEVPVFRRDRLFRSPAMTEFVRAGVGQVLSIKVYFGDIEETVRFPVIGKSAANLLLKNAELKTAKGDEFDKVLLKSLSFAKLGWAHFAYPLTLRLSSVPTGPLSHQAIEELSRILNIETP